MTASNAILYSVVLSIFLVVFSLGARATFDDASFLFRRPWLLARAVTAIYVIVPAFAVAVCLVFPIPPYGRFALVALAVSPLPPILPRKEMLAGADRRYAIGLLVAISLIALVATPLLVTLAYEMLGAEVRFDAAAVLKPLLMSIALPLGLGMALNRFAPGTAEALSRYTMAAGLTLLVAGGVIVLLHEWRTVAGLVGNGTVLAFAAAVTMGLVAGHLLGVGGDRTSLALAASTRHPGIAIAIAAGISPGGQKTAAAAVLLFLLTNLIVTMPYVRWAKGRAAHAGAGSAEGPG